MAYRITISIEDKSLSGGNQYDDSTNWYSSDALPVLQKIAVALSETVEGLLDGYFLIELETDEQGYPVEEESDD